MDLHLILLGIAIMFLILGSLYQGSKNVDKKMSTEVSEANSIILMMFGIGGLFMIYMALKDYMRTKDFYEFRDIPFYFYTQKIAYIWILVSVVSIAIGAVYQDKKNNYQITDVNTMADVNSIILLIFGVLIIALTWLMVFWRKKIQSKRIHKALQYRQQ